LVEDPRYGRVEVTWDAFERAEFTESRETGNGYDSYRPAARLRATVTDLDGDARTGLIYFDLDEAESWEFLNGISRGVEYNIPFAMVSSIEPRRRDSAEVTLRSGETLRLVDGQDVSDNNDGVLLFVNEEDDDPVYLGWEDVGRIDFVQ
jgi:hypothetical protein